MVQLSFLCNQILTCGAVGLSKSVGGLPATVLLWGAEGSSGLVPEVPAAEVLPVNRDVVLTFTAVKELKPCGSISSPIFYTIFRSIKGAGR